ncbi:MAG: DUF6493 family protein [Pseudomonadota bacterium]
MAFDLTEETLINLLKTKPAHAVLDALRAHPQKVRRVHAKAVVSLYAAYQESRFSGGGVSIADDEALDIGLLATATLTDLKKVGYFPYTRQVPLETVFAALQPEWTQAFVDHFVTSNPNLVVRVAPLWRAGLATRPEGDAIILGYYALYRGDGEDEAELLKHDVWRFFEVEGGGEFSLANHDKFVKQGSESWQARLVDYADAGKLDRQRLLDVSLEALARDFGQYRAGWYTRFHTALAPTPEETAARAERYLGLLGSAVPPTVSFAMKAVQALDKAEHLAPGVILDGIEPALQARAKGTVAAALKLLARAAQRDPNLQSQAARLAMVALICEDAGVQGKALDLIERLSDSAQDADRAALAEYADLVAPSLRPRIAALSGVTHNAVSHAPPQDAAAPPTAQPVHPVGSAEDALALFLSVLETPRDPIEVERAVDGLARFGAEWAADAARLSPLRKRARQIWDKPGDGLIRAVLALTGRALAEGTPALALLADAPEIWGLTSPEASTLQRVHLRRNSEITEQVCAGHDLPLLSLPSDTSGRVAATDLRTRLAAYRAADAEPAPTDLALALMRLAPGDAVPDAVPTDAGEAERALAYALGTDVPAGPTAEVWAAAWSARRSSAKAPEIAALFETPLPGCGVPVTYTLDVQRTESPDGAYFWISVAVPVTPKLPNTADVLPALYAFQPPDTVHMSFNCGMTFADIAWASLIMPSDPEPFFRQGILMQDTWQKLTDNHTRAFLEPFLRPGPSFGPLGAGLLAYDMACEDKSVSSLAAEAAALVLLQGRLSVADFADALRAFVMSGALPTARWTKAFAAMAESGAEAHVRELIARILTFPGPDTPRDIGGMLELLYELHVAAGTSLDRPETCACLETIEGGGKVAKFSKKLRALARVPADVC